MIHAVRLQATIELMHEVDSVPRPADAVVSAWFRARRYIGDKAHGQILELLYALLRHQGRLGWWLVKHGREDMPRTRLLAWLTLKEGKTPDQIKRLFNGAKFAPAILMDHEHALTRRYQLDISRLSQTSSNRERVTPPNTHPRTRLCP
ncbi:MULTISPECIES: hypothetical protein [unclassified Mesorhizobium]|uniref:hypothetical protein n=1 Tax=unclassified Mesorhizobium TaxID=325217 RepID=UPI0015E3E345|nr:MULTISPECIES: hypothetical protein [unclassified Mesorhizobium]